MRRVHPGPLAVTGIADPRLGEYVRELFAPEDEVLEAIARRVAEAGVAPMEITADVGKLLHVLVRAAGARRVLEVGTLLGYSAIWMARALRPGGRLVTLELDPDRAAQARAAIARAGLDAVIEVRQGLALELLPPLVEELRAGDPPFDLAFIDAAKREYPQYLDHALELVRPGGLILADNTLIAGVGAIVDEPESPDARPAIEAVRAFNERLATDPRLVSTILPIREGVSISVVLGSASV